MTTPTTPDRRQFMEQLQETSERSSRKAEPDASKEQIFQKRADSLAQCLSNSHSEGKRIPILGFTVGNERCAIELSHLSEVLPLERLSKVPHAADWTCGVMNVRGDIFGVIDLKVLLSLPATETPLAGYVLIMKKSDMGLWIDRIGKIVFAAAGDIAGEEVARNAVSARFIKCVLPGYVLLLDAEKILSELQ